MHVSTELVHCKCQVCSGPLSFDRANLGETVSCPHCKMDTILFALQPAFKPDVKIPNPIPTAEWKPSQRDNVAPVGFTLKLLGLIAGLGLLGLMCAIITDQPADRAIPFIIEFVGAGMMAACLWMIYFKLRQIHEVLKEIRRDR